MGDVHTYAYQKMAQHSTVPIAIVPVRTYTALLKLLHHVVRTYLYVCSTVRIVGAVRTNKDDDIFGYHYSVQDSRQAAAAEQLINKFLAANE